LQKRNIPQFKSNEEMLDLLLREEYGYLPEKPSQICFKEEDVRFPEISSDKVISKKVEITSRICGEDFTFPIYANIPDKEGKHPFFVCINFRDCIPDIYIPVEEIIEQGFAVLSFCYKDVTDDNDDFNDGLAGVLYKNGKRGKSDAGKISMWAWAAQRVMDYAQTLDCLDLDNAIVCGHSRLGKTALLAAATDERFKFAYSNESGCCGAAITREKEGENVKEICYRFPYWFCENFLDYVDKEGEMPFDQHYLTALIVPRYVYIASAKEDLWADPVSEMLNCVAISRLYEEHGKTGFICPDRLPEVDDMFHDGCVGYHLRAGQHRFLPEDWNKAMKFIRKHMQEV